MDHRIGSLHVTYRVHGRTLDAALTPGFDRAIQNGLADAVNARLTAMFGDDPAVIVVRELNTALSFDKETLLDSRVIERMCASSVDALGRVLARESSSESVIRFADQAEFVGSFIVDLVDGRAWGHWYYGAFRRFRRADPRETIRAILAESGVDAARVVAWLQRHGKLDALMELTGPQDALALIDQRECASREAHNGAGAEILADAGFRLLAALGWRDVATSRSELLARFLATRPAAARWVDRRSLSEWVLAFVRFAAARAPASLPELGTRLPGAVHALLGGALDWLDGPWLVGALSTMPTDIADRVHFERVPDRALLTVRQSRILANLARRLREASVRVPDGASEADLIVRLIAAATDDLGADETLDRTLVAAIEEIARAAANAVVQKSSSGHDAHPHEPASMHQRASTAGFVSTSSSTPQALRGYGRAAADLLQAVRAAQSTSDQQWQRTASGGLFLLTRALLDTRFPALARDAGVPLPPLLGAIAIKLLAVRAPFDAATALWVGAESVDYDALESASAEVHALQAALLDLLIAQRVLDETEAYDRVDVDARSLSVALPGSQATDLAVSRILSLLTHAWSHWLRGVAHSSVAFMVDNCLRRAARARITDSHIAVDLDPAPLDVVLQMSGYLGRLDAVPWLGDRSISFTVRRAP
jgi:hypothetical protein